MASEAGLLDGPTARRVDTGLQAGVGFRIDGLVLQANYSLGFTNTLPTYTSQGASSIKAYNRGFQVGIGYLFNAIR